MTIREEEQATMMMSGGQREVLAGEAVLVEGEAEAEAVEGSPTCRRKTESPVIIAVYGDTEQGNAKRRVTIRMLRIFLGMSDKQRTTTKSST